MATTVTGTQAIEMAEARGLTLCKYTDPTEGAREGLTVAEARAVARQDPSLIYVETTELVRNVCDEVAGLVGDDGTGDLGIIVRQALAEDPTVSAEAIAETVREARRDATVERERESADARG